MTVGDNMPNDDDVAFTLVVDYFKPSGKWYETVSTDVTFVEVPRFFDQIDHLNLFFEKTGRLVPHPEFTSFIRIENQHPEDHNFCRYLIQPELRRQHTSVEEVHSFLF